MLIPETGRPQPKTDRPMVSVIVAVKNASATLQRCIDSVVGQTWPGKELIVCDGASSDGTRAIIERNQANLAYWCSQRDHGIYDAWNRGLSHAHGDWICFLGADDIFWSPTVLASAMAQAGKVYPRERVIYGRVALLTPDGTFLRYLGKPWGKAKEQLMQINSLPHPGLLCHRSVFQEHGIFDISYRISGDYEFLLRELKSGDAHFMEDVITVGMQTGGISSRTNWIRLALKEIRRAQKKHGFRYPGPLWIAAYLRALVRSAIAGIIGEEKTDKVIDVLRRF